MPFSWSLHPPRPFLRQIKFSILEPILGNSTRPVPHHGVGEGDRPGFRPPNDREGGAGGRPPREGFRPDGAGGNDRARQEFQRREDMFDGLRKELGRVHQENAELKRRLQLLEQRLSQLEKR